MSDTTLNKYHGEGDDAVEAAFTPTPSTAVTAPENAVLFVNKENPTVPILKWWDGANFVTLANASAAGTVTNTGTLTDHAVVVGNGGVDVSTLASLGTAGQVLESAGAGVDPAFATPMFALIEVLTPTGTNVTFSSLGTFTHLKIVWQARGDTAAANVAGGLQFNGDTGANYFRQQVFTNATTVTASESGAATSATTVINVAAASAAAGISSCGVIDIPNYRGTAFHKGGVGSMSLRTGTATGTQFTFQTAFSWQSTAAITSIVITLTAGNFVTGSTFSLYGMR